MAFKKPLLPKATDSELFINKGIATDYTALDEHQLVNEYLSVDQQSQLLKGKILLAIRNRFPNNHEFGDFIEKNLGTICSDTRQSRTRFMNLARFFENREIDKISISAAYEISAPINADIAVEVYNEVKGRNLPLAEVRRQIAIKKGTPNVSAVPVDDSPRFEDKYKPVGIVEVKKEVETISTDLVNNSTDLDIKQKIHSDIASIPPFDAIRLLQEVIKEINAKIYGR